MRARLPLIAVRQRCQLVIRWETGEGERQARGQTVGVEGHHALVIGLIAGGFVNKRGCLEHQLQTSRNHGLPIRAFCGCVQRTGCGCDEAIGFVPVYERVLDEIIADVDIVVGHHANLVALATARACGRGHRKYPAASTRPITITPIRRYFWRLCFS